MSTVGGNKAAVEKYIKNQQQEDMISDQISMKEYFDPFKDEVDTSKANPFRD